MRRLLTLLLLLALAAPALPAQAQASTAQLAVQAGMGGAYRSGEWFPVIVDISNDGPDMRGSLEWELPSARNEQTVRTLIDLPRGARKRVVLSSFSRGFARSGTARLRSGDVVVAEQSVALDPIDADRYIIGVLSSDPTLLNSLESVSFGSAPGTKVLHLTPDQLPAQAPALRSLNALIIHNIDTSQLSQAQRDAMRLWASLGGQLVVGGGLGGQLATAGLADLLPAAVSASVAEGDVSALARLGGQELPGGATRAPLTALQPRQGAVDPIGDGLLYRAPLGAGSVSVAAFDLALIGAWSAAPSALLQVIVPRTLFAPSLSSRNNQTSVIEAALQLPGLGLPSPWALMLFLLGYILVLGPANYLILRRIGRLEWAWLSAPLIVIIFAAGLYLVGFSGRGSQMQVSQVTVVQASEGQPQALATGFVAIFSPRRAAYTVGFGADTLLHETRGWEQVASRGEPITVSDGAVELRDMLVDIASVRTLVAEAPVAEQAAIQSSITPGRVASGQLRNGGAALQDVVLVQDGSFISLGALAAGSSASFDFAQSQPNFPWSVVVPEEGLFNRKTLLTSLFTGDTTILSLDGSALPLNPGEVYLIGWSSAPSLAVRVDGGEVAQSGYTLHVVRLGGG